MTSSVRVAAVLRIAVVALMIGAMVLGTDRQDWPAQSALLACYGCLLYTSDAADEL